jgi:anti-anti-sigma regulatory factor
VKSLIAEGKLKIVLNMKEIEYINSAGLGMLVAAHLTTKTQGASMPLCNLGFKFQEVLRITKLTSIFEVCGTEASAVASLSAIAICGQLAKSTWHFAGGEGAGISHAAQRSRGKY